MLPASMRAIQVARHGWPQSLPVRTCPLPTPQPHQVLVRVGHSGVNFADALVLGGSYQEKPALPFVPGSELCGEVVSLGDAVTDLAVGDRVMGQVGQGAFAEYAVLDVHRQVKVPTVLSDADAAGFYIPFGTAHAALLQRARLTSVDKVLVLGASGAVGHASAQVALAVGAQVICAASSFQRLAPEWRERVSWVAPDARSLRDDVLAVTQGRGVDVVVDTVGGAVGEQAMRCLGFEGRYVVVGFAAGHPPALRANHVLVKNIDVMGCYWGPYQQLQPAQTRAAFARLFGWLEKGLIRPLPSLVVELDGVADAIEALVERRQPGKIVVRIGAKEHALENV